MSDSENKCFSHNYYSDELLQAHKTLIDKIKKARDEAVRRGIEANIILIDKGLAFVKGFDYVSKSLVGFDYTSHLPPMILGMEAYISDLKEFPPETAFVVTHTDSTAIDKIREEAKKELLKELREMSLSDLMIMLESE